MKCKYYNPYMDFLRKIVDEYYQLEECCSGGPLHVLLDDDNYDIGSVRWCMKYCFEGLAKRDTAEDTTLDYSESANILGIMICNEYARMTLEERAAFDTYMNGNDLECDGNCENCPCGVLDDLYEDIKEIEEDKSKEQEMKDHKQTFNFKIGDRVYASDWCYGEIIRLENDIAWVEFETSGGGGTAKFYVDDLTKEEE